MIPDAASNHMRRYLHGAGKAPWALITGATGGMGVEWAYQLATLGFNIVIQGRNRAKLDEVRTTIMERKGPQKVRRRSSLSSTKRKAPQMLAKGAGPLELDNEQGTRPVPNHVEVELLVCEATVWPNETLESGLNETLFRKSVRLTVVINNLGVQSEGYPCLEDLSREEVAGIVIANSLFPAEVSRSVLPLLKKNQPSLLVTVTSIGAWTPTP